MRKILPFALLLAACSQQSTETTLATGTFAGEGRDRLCLAGDPGNYHGGLIAFGASDENCSASGKIDIQGDQLALVPSGEGDCRIPLTVEGNVVQVGEVPASCSYYCGPGATLAGKRYNRSAMGAAVTDLAGDALC